MAALTAMEKNYGAKAPDPDEIRMCNCAGCGRELVGRADAQHAHLVGAPVAKFAPVPHPPGQPDERPYCGPCYQRQQAKRHNCRGCAARTPLSGVVFQAGAPYCVKCATPAPDPARHLKNEHQGNDRHFLTEPVQEAA